MAPTKKSEKNIYQRIADVTSAIKSFEKDGTNAKFNFKFAGIEKVVTTIQPICIENGITLIYEARMLEPIHNEGKDIARCDSVLIAVNMDNPDDRHSIPMPGYGFDMLDKGIYKAITGARKYAIMGMFNLTASEDEPDADNESSAPSAQRAQSKPTPASKPRQHTSTPKASTSGDMQRIVDTLFSEVEPGWPPKNEKNYDVKLIDSALAGNDKFGWAFKYAERNTTGALIAKAVEAGYQTDEQRHKLFTAIYIAFGIGKKGRVTSTQEMQVRHTAFLFDAMEHINPKAPDDPYPWSEGAQATPEAVEQVDLDPDEDEFLID